MRCPRPLHVLLAVVDSPVPLPRLQPALASMCNTKPAALEAVPPLALLPQLPLQRWRLRPRRLSLLRLFLVLRYALLVCNSLGSDELLLAAQQGGQASRLVLFPLDLPFFAIIFAIRSKCCLPPYCILSLSQRLRVPSRMRTSRAPPQVWTAAGRNAIAPFRLSHATFSSLVCYYPVSPRYLNADVCLLRAQQRPSFLLLLQAAECRQMRLLPVGRRRYFVLLALLLPPIPPRNVF
jgi:hypothetical protein